MARRFVYSKEPTLEDIATELGVDPSDVTIIKSRGRIEIEFALDLSVADVQKLDTLLPGFRRS